MSRTSTLLEPHRAIFDDPRFHQDPTPARIRIEVRTATGTEAWSASTEQGRFGLRPAGPESVDAHVVIRVSDDDLADHLLGRGDLFTHASEAFEVDHDPHGLGGDTPTVEQLVELFYRILGALEVACHGREELRGSPMEAPYLAWRSLREDGSYRPMGQWSIPFHLGVELYDLVKEQRPARTLEVGMAHGLSALFIATALEELGAGEHVAVDPCQATWFGRCGTGNVARAGLAHRVRVIEEPNYVALPGLLGERFDLIFIDGLHIFDHVLLDFFFCDMLLAVGGRLVFDDSTLPAVREVQQFIETNRFDGYERLESGPLDRIQVYRKVAEDPRVDKYGPVFHRPFAGEVELPEPLPPPPSPRVLKRVADATLAGLGLVLTAPIGLAVALGFWLEDLAHGRLPRSPFQRQRTLSAGREIGSLCFRATAPSLTAKVLSKLRLGRWPQLWNVLRGDMALVGLGEIHTGDRVQRARYGSCGIPAGLMVAGLRSDVPFVNERYHGEYLRRRGFSLLAFDLRVLLRKVFRRH